MRYLIAVAAAAVALLGAGCGSSSSSSTSTPTATVSRPPKLPVVTNAETQAIPLASKRPCRHYIYVIGPDGRRHRAPCPSPAPEPDGPHPAPSTTPTPAPNPSPYHPASGCGTERWSVKTMTDPGANQVALGTVVPSTVATLGSIAAPAGPTDRLAPVETTVYRITGTLTIAKQEADHDFHLVIADAAGHTMIVEVPDPACAVGSVVARQIATVRSQFVAKYGTPGSYPTPDLRPNVPVTVTGVGFFDRIHGQTGVAPNGIELHPVLSLTSP